MKNQNLNESGAEVVLIPIGVIFVLLYVIPFLLIVYANYIATLFKSVQVKDEKLTKRIRDICNYPVEVYVSKLDMYNAWNIGTRKIFITEKLINKLSEREVDAILLHETGHYANKDVQKIQFMVEPIGKLLVISIIVTIMGAMAAAGIIIPILPIFLGLYLGAIKRLIIGKTFGRDMEFLADSFASEHGYGKDLYSALRTLHGEFKKIVCKDLDKTACTLRLEEHEFWDEHPNLKERKLNIELKKPKYTDKALSKDPSKAKLTKLSFFELRSTMKELKEELKKEKNKGKK